MEWLVVIGAIIGLLTLPQLLSGKETKLFRRLWSSERLGGIHGQKAQSKAIDLLITRYGIDFDDPDGSLHTKIWDLIGSASEFDVKYRRNKGILVSQIVSRCLHGKIVHERHKFTKDMLEMMRDYDVVASHNSGKKAIRELGL